MTDVVSELPARGVFLSYSSRDRDTALRLKRGLERLGVSVRLDTESMRVGQNIRAFILESIRGTSATLLVVSEASLVSDWVGIEVSTSLVDGELWGNRSFFACYVDDGFLHPEFRLRATDAIDTRIAGIDRLLPDYGQRKLDTNDLNSEKSRLYELRNELGVTLDRLRNSLTVDIRNEQFEPGLQRLVAMLRPIAPGKQAPLDAASDIEQRKEEIYALVANGDGDRALKRIMDFVRDFSDDKRRMLTIVVTIGNYRKLEAEQGRSLQEVRHERTEILLGALELLEQTTETLTLKVAS